LRICGVLLLLSACQHAPPKRIQLELSPLALSSAPLKALVWAWDEQGSKTIAKEGVKFAASPAELASVTSDGQVTCLTSGDGEVSADLFGVGAKAPLKCRLVARLEACLLYTSPSPRD
jgi:hypothetical protein